MINLGPDNDPQVIIPDTDERDASTPRDSILGAASSPTSRRRAKPIRANGSNQKIPTSNNPSHHSLANRNAVSSSGSISSSSTVSNNMNKLDDAFSPGTYDVICARGGQARNHPGNIDLKNKVIDAGDSYAKAPSKVFKTLIVSSIVDWVRSRSPNGGFVKKMNDGAWYEVGDEVAREKVGQALRDLNHSHYKSSMRAKRQRWKKEQQEQSRIANRTQPRLQPQLLLLPIEAAGPKGKKTADHQETRFERILRTHHNTIQSSLQHVQQKWIEYGGNSADEDQLLTVFTQHNTMLLVTFKQATSGGPPKTGHQQDSATQM